MDWREVPSNIPDTRAYQRDLSDDTHLTALVAREPDSHGVLWWHISVSHRNNRGSTPGRAVTRAEMQDARNTLLRGWGPNHTMIYVDLASLVMSDTYAPGWEPAPNITHLWEIPSELWD